MSQAAAQHEYGITPVEEPVVGKYDAIVLAVAHCQFREISAAQLRRYGKEKHVLFDLKYVLPKEDADMRL